jgi:hypothetical protein
MLTRCACRTFFVLPNIVLCYQTHSAQVNLNHWVTTKWTSGKSIEKLNKSVLGHETTVSCWMCVRANYKKSPKCHFLLLKNVLAIIVYMLRLILGSLGNIVTHYCRLSSHDFNIMTNFAQWFLTLINSKLFLKKKTICEVHCVFDIFTAMWCIVLQCSVSNDVKRDSAAMCIVL